MEKNKHNVLQQGLHALWSPFAQSIVIVDAQITFKHA